jgi:hypothetical protein
MNDVKQFPCPICIQYIIHSVDSIRSCFAGRISIRVDQIYLKMVLKDII